nr:SPOR domain-containing protein [Pseudomonas sp. dw_358]
MITALFLALAGCGSAVENAGKAVLAKVDNPKTARFNNVRSTPEGNVCGQVKVKDANGNYGGYMAYVALRHGGDYEAVIDQDGNNATVRAACTSAQDQALAQASGAAAHSSSGQWEVRIAGGDNMGNITDMASRLVEGGFMANFAKKDGVTQVYLGPFSSKEEAEQKRTALMASKGIDSLVLPFDTAP